MDQRVMQQKFYGPLRAIKLYNAKYRQENIPLILLISVSRPNWGMTPGWHELLPSGHFTLFTAIQ